MEKPRDTTAGLSEGARVAISLVVIIHLCSMAFAALSSLRGHSDLLDRLGTQVPGVAHYTQFLLMRSYGFNLTYNLDIDWDHECDMLVNWQQGLERTPQEVEKLKRLPLVRDGDHFPQQRKRRYQMLAYNVANLAENETVGPELPQAISAALLAEADIKDGQHRFRCRRQSTAQPEFTPPPRLEPAWLTAYEADATFFRGKVNISKADPGRLTAPVVRPSPAKQDPPPQPPQPSTPNANR